MYGNTSELNLGTTLKSKLAIFKLKFCADLVLKFATLFRLLNMTNSSYMLWYVSFVYVIETPVS